MMASRNLSLAWFECYDITGSVKTNVAILKIIKISKEFTVNFNLVPRVSSSLYLYSGMKQ